ncbi:MAG: c-type cytochrome [Marinicella sp.]
MSWANSKGNPISGYPILAGQHADYTAKQLHDFKGGKTVTNKDDVNGQIMADAARYLTEEEIVAVSSYLQGLKSAE